MKVQTELCAAAFWISVVWGSPEVSSREQEAVALAEEPGRKESAVATQWSD